MNDQFPVPALHTYLCCCLQTPMQGEDNSTVSCCCCWSGNVHAMIRIARQGYVPGEAIKIYAKVTNQSNTEVINTRIALKQVGCMKSLNIKHNPVCLKHLTISQYQCHHCPARAHRLLVSVHGILWSL